MLALELLAVMASADRSNEVKYLVLLGLSILIMFSRIATVHAKELSLETDRQALEKLKVAVDPSDNLLPWVSGTNSCTWIGVECHQNRVAYLHIPGF